MRECSFFVLNLYSFKLCNSTIDTYYTKADHYVTLTLSRGNEIKTRKHTLFIKSCIAFE